MLINPKVVTRHFIGDVEVVTARGIAKRYPERYGTSDVAIRKALRGATAPTPYAIKEGSHGDIFWKLDEALAHLDLIEAKRAELDALGIKRAGRPRKLRLATNN